jgi:SPP1 gp7 family putative phage head morphogenesis protein
MKAPQPIQISAKTNKPDKIKIVSKKTQIKKKIQDDKEVFRSELEQNVNKYAIEYKRVVTQFSQKQEDKVIDKINATSKRFEEWLFNIKDESEALAKELEPVVLALIEEQGQDVVNFITGEPIDFKPIKANYLKQHIKAVVGFEEDLLRDLEKSLAEGVEQGQSLTKLKKRVNGVYEKSQGYKAERIARTESAKIANSTAEDVYKQNGYSTVEWYVNPGACEFCLSLSGKSKEIGSQYKKVGDTVTGTKGGIMTLQYDDVNVPPLHPNCTCSIVPGA